MEPPQSLEDRISARYGALSDKLQAAADYIIASPVEVATRSLRSVAAASGLAPSTFSRLARALGFSTYEDLREMSRQAVSRRAGTFSDKARRLRADADDGAGLSLMQRQVEASLRNIEDLSRSIPVEKLYGVVEALRAARRVRLIGAMSSRPILEYMLYLAEWLSDDWSMAAAGDASLAAALAGAEASDAFIVLSMPPFAATTLRAAEIAAGKGAYVLVITDTHTCPALKHASASLTAPTDSPHFFSSYVSTLVLIETLISMLVAQSELSAEGRMREIEEQNRSLGRYWSG